MVCSSQDELDLTKLFIPHTPQIEDGRNGGCLNTCYEVTSKVLAERRLQVLRNLAQSTTTARSLEELAEAVIDSLRENPKDIPFMMLYHGVDTCA